MAITYKWNALSLLDVNEEVLWTLEGSFSEETMMGFLLSGLALIEEERKTINEQGETRGFIENAFVITKQKTGEEILIEEENDFEPLDKFGFVIDPKHIYLGDLDAGMIRLFVWVSSPAGRKFYRKVDLVNMNLFLQGFITMCNAFQVDFRDYILHFPIDSDGTEYDLPEYHLREYFEEKNRHKDRQDE